MTRDYLAGLVLSGLLHAGLVVVDGWFPKVPPLEKAVEKSEPFIEWTPKEEPPEETYDPDPAEASEPAREFRLPQAPEVFGPVELDGTFTQLPQPTIDRPLLPAGNIIIPSVGRSGTGDGRSGRPTFDIKDLDQPPVARFQGKAIYPFEMRRSNTEGDVLVGFIVDASGSVRDVYAIRSTHREFEAAAILAVSKWRFRPGQKSGRAANTRMQVPIVFTINED